MSRIPPRKSDDSRIIRQPLDHTEGDPFAAFSEWTSDADEKAYAGLGSQARKIQRRPPNL
jgi:hypothetical protein